MKKCKKCKAGKPLDRFPIDRRRSDGRHPYCKPCKSVEQGVRARAKTAKKLSATQRPCTRCGELRDQAMFTGPRGWACEICRSSTKMQGSKKNTLAARERYNGNDEWRRSRARRLQDNRKRRKRALLKLMGDCCQDCGIRPGEQWPVEVFDFHHEGSKTESLTRLLFSNSKWDEAVEEAQKCVILCSNCHRKHHAGKNNVT